jgi:hypothetical protein
MLTSAAKEACKPDRTFTTNIWLKCQLDPTFFAHDSYADVRRLWHGQVMVIVVINITVAIITITITITTTITITITITCIMATSLPPSPIAAVRAPPRALSSSTTAAFCVGEQRQHT